MFALVVIFMYVGNLVAGEQGMMTALLMAGGINFVSYFFSDKMVLSSYRATKVDSKNAPKLYEIVQRLAKNAGLPMPKVYIIPEETPNAFATGRNPSHAAVATTQGLLNLMTDEESENERSYFNSKMPFPASRIKYNLSLYLKILDILSLDPISSFKNLEPTLFLNTSVI